MAASLIQPVAYSLVKSNIGKGVMKAGKGVIRAGRGYYNMDNMDKHFSSAPSFKQYQDYRSISKPNLDLMVSFQEIIYLK